MLVVLESSVERSFSCLAVIPAYRSREAAQWTTLALESRLLDTPRYLLALEPAVMLACATALGVWRGGSMPPCEGVDRPEIEGVARPLTDGVARPESEGVARPLSRTELREEATDAGRGMLPGPPTVGG